MITKYSKRIIGCSLLVIILFSVFLFSNEVHGYTSGAEAFGQLYISIPEHDAVFDGPAIYYYTIDGEIVYCIEMATRIFKTEYYDVPYSNHQIAYALVADHGYGGNLAADFQIRQAVIWALLGQINIENLQPGDPG